MKLQLFFDKKLKQKKKEAFSEFIVLKKSKPFQRGNINRGTINIGNILIW